MILKTRHISEGYHMVITWLSHIIGLSEDYQRVIQRVIRGLLEGYHRVYVNPR